ncbi:MAG: hypothetical protein LBD75_01920, partial [Candidatus Peribacteria bacterium]|nr:hypothetical protein [Candidatus Peribacteria bacterium]
MKKLTHRVMLGMLLMNEVGIAGMPFKANAFNYLFQREETTLQRERTGEKEFPNCFMLVAKKASSF